MPELRIGSLCSGYGGLDMAVMDVLDAEVAWHAQYDPDDRHQWAAQILAHHWPGVPNHGDITSIDWTAVEPVDILTAGFPCQPVSNAGKRKGHKDDRWLWPDVEAAIRGVRPRLVFLENVSALANRGGDAVLGSLAALGFDAEWICLRASDVGAPHRRNRWFCLAWPADAPRPRLEARREGRPGGGAAADPAHVGYERGWPARLWRPGSADGRVAAPDSQGFRRVEGRTEPARKFRGSDASLGGGTAAPDAAGLGHGNAGQAGLGGVSASPVAGGAAAAPDSDRAGARPECDREPRRSEADDEHEVSNAAGRVLDWGPYGPAIARWEHVMCRPAPYPTEPGRNGERLSPRFVEWMMGAPEGHITGVPGVPRNAQLKAAGNGVVRQQGEAALRLLLDKADR